MRLVILLLLALAPVPPAPRPDAVGDCPFGRIEITGRRIVIVGPLWTAHGEIAQGWAHVTWTLGGRRARASYWMAEGGFDGAWAWDDDGGEPIREERFPVTWAESP